MQQLSEKKIVHKAAHTGLLQRVEVFEAVLKKSRLLLSGLVPYIPFLLPGISISIRSYIIWNRNEKDRWTVANKPLSYERDTPVRGVMVLRSQLNSWSE